MERVPLSQDGYAQTIISCVRHAEGNMTDLIKRVPTPRRFSDLSERCVKINNQLKEGEASAVQAAINLRDEVAEYLLWMESLLNIGPI